MLTLVGSRLTPPPPPEIQEMVELLRTPEAPPPALEDIDEDLRH
ncbi:hypothetical protein [Oxynema sp. CENA135]|nr:hypothetical protein [Oxynema sp. CENA135]